MNLAKWVFAMDKFYRVNKIVKPKKEQLKVAEEKYESVMKVLKVKQAELKKVVDQVNALQKDLNDTKEAKESLEAKVADCQAKLIRAEQLIKGLGGEKARWKAARIGVRSRRRRRRGSASGKLPLPQAFLPRLPPTARGPRGIINVTDYVINAQQK